MVISRYLKKTIIVSCLGHMFFFTLFTLSFGARIKKLNYAAISFLGAVLINSEFQTSIPAAQPAIKTIKRLSWKHTAGLLKEPGQKVFSEGPPYPKPLNRIGLQNKNSPTSLDVFWKVTLPVRKEPSITFHPSLPYYFNIYFKERQDIQIELQFNITDKVDNRIIHLKRKVSSGNLEADLLTMRYMEHYLFNQQTKFAANLWQKVKINLTPKVK